MNLIILSVSLTNSFQGDWLLVVDESHVTLPQLKAMYGGDQSRKRLLVSEQNPFAHKVLQEANLDSL